MVERPHCATDPPLEPLRPPCTSTGQASELLAPLAEHVLAGKYDDLGIHVGELRQHGALDRLERILGTGHYAPSSHDASLKVAA